MSVLGQNIVFSTKMTYHSGFRAWAGCVRVVAAETIETTRPVALSQQDRACDVVTLYRL